MAEERPSTTRTSDLRLLRQFEGVVNLDAEVADRALQLGVPEQQLHRPEILRPPVDQRSLGTPD